MTEFVAPYSKQHMFMVLHKYNPGPEPILATCQVIRDSSFFPASSSTYVAAVSLRLSMFGNPHSGYVYSYVEPDWRIACDVSEDSVDVHNTDTTPMIAYKYDLRNANTDNLGTISLASGRAMRASEEILSDETNDIGHILESFAGYVNNYAIDKYSTIQIPHVDTNNDVYWIEVRVVGNPIHLLRGPGYGFEGLGTMRGGGQLASHWNVAGSSREVWKAAKWSEIPLETAIQGGEDEDITSFQFPELFQFHFTVDKNYLGMDSIEEFAAFLSSGVNLYHEQIHSGCVFDVLGPYRVNKFEDVEDDEKALELVWDEVDGDNKNGAKLPKYRIVMQQGKKFQTGFCDYYEMDAHGGDVDFSKRAHIDVPDDWYNGSGNMWHAYLTCRPSKHGTNQFSQYDISGKLWRGESDANQQLQWKNFITFPVDEFTQNIENPYAWNAYTCRDKLNLAVVIEDCPVELIQARKVVSGDLEDVNFSTTMLKETTSFPDLNLKLLHFNVNRTRIEAGSFEPEPVGVYTVNEMFEMFNAPRTGNQDANWQLQTHSNGGFCVQIKKEMARFEISKAFADALGLKNSITTIAQASMDASDQTQTNWILMRVKTLTGQQPLAYIGQTTFSQMIREDSLDSYVDVENREPIDLSVGTSELIGKVVLHEHEGRAYKILRRIETSYRDQLTHKRQEVANLRMIDGVPTYQFENPPIGIIENTSQISVASFALFEGLQITLPDLPFMPQLTSWSNGERCLLELRFPINYGTGNNGAGEVTATSFEQIGDIIWSAGGAGFEWLPVSSIGDLYQVTANASLIFRDALGRPPRPVYLPQNGIMQVKIAFLEIK